MCKETGIDNILKMVARLSIDKASNVFSKLIRTGAKVELEDIYFADMTKITRQFFKDNYGEVVASFVELEGEASFSFLFFVKEESGRILTDLMVRQEVGQTKEHDEYVDAAVQEIGNVLASSIANVFSDNFQIRLTPTPPIVVHDTADVIFVEYIGRALTPLEEMLMIDVTFRVVNQDIDCRMFILPTKDSRQVLTYISGSNLI
jgi:chemotaxis protein CheY-P-specific phosphatase CheC